MPISQLLKMTEMLKSLNCAPKNGGTSIMKKVETASLAISSRVKLMSEVNYSEEQLLKLAKQKG
ncbi:hypothetical protein I4641_09465 [Waterburya agarophytonicola K14]|uniref:Uncharacterized protein n=1 Tax=Waterburya agarophytonicola KI4 TaxID=2874699 RepID=A0A964BQ26_9CYAN|nr:hypothetical protein [Waterburya agarophytonicola]MCC0177204.1 hypothetical protein [Waterburya agarophytonicola KI4]